MNSKKKTDELSPKFLEEVRREIITKERNLYRILKYLRANDNFSYTNYQVERILRYKGDEIIIDFNVQMLPELLITGETFNDEDDDYFKVINIENIRI